MPDNPTADTLSPIRHYGRQQRKPNCWGGSDTVGKPNFESQTL